MNTTPRMPKRRGRPRIRFEPDVRVTIRFRPDRDDDLLAWLAELPGRQRAGTIRQILRRQVQKSRAESDSDST